MKVGIEVTVVAPEVNPAAVDKELWEAAAQRGLYKTLDMGTADSGNALEAIIAASDIVYTDTWVDMEFFTDPTFCRRTGAETEKNDALSIERRTVEGARLQDYALPPGTSRLRNRR